MQYDPKDQLPRRQGRKKEQEQQVPAAELLLAPASGVPEPPRRRGIKVQEPMVVQSQETYWVNLFVCVVGVNKSLECPS